MAYAHNHVRPTQGYVLSKALISAQQFLGITQKQLSNIVHTSESTICRLKNGSELDPSSAEGHFAVLFIRIYRDLASLLNSDVRVRDWLFSYNKNLSGVPIDMMQDLVGLFTVLNYLDTMRGNSA